MICTAAQLAIRAALVASPAVVALVPAAAILDRHKRPLPSPCILLGEDDAQDMAVASGNLTDVRHTLHVWKAEPSTEGVKAICDALRKVLAKRLPVPVAGVSCAGCRVVSVRVMRDPGGDYSHGVVVVQLMMHEAMQ